MMGGGGGGEFARFGGNCGRFDYLLSMVFTKRC
jgi:hypothetical protein